jgi:2-polyprenyl-3-methyl-5-hydroxy-6-metoxy-1,4-benzoquinol methylase
LKLEAVVGSELAVGHVKGLITKVLKTVIKLYFHGVETAVKQSFHRHQQCVVCGSVHFAALRGYEEQYLVKCGSCEMVFAERIPTEEELSSFYSTYSYSSDPWVSPITLKRYHTLLDEFERYRLTGRILDTGCGAGHFLAVARERGWEVFGNEFSPAAVGICEAKGISMVHGALGSPSKAPEGFSALEGGFDVVTSFEVLEHVNTPVDDLKVLHRYLRDGGLLYVTTPNFNAFARRWLGVQYNVLNYPEHLSYFTSKTLDAAAKHAGFSRLRSWSEGVSLSRIAGSRTPSAEIRIGSKEAPDERLRQRTETQWFWKFVKRLANSAFRLTGTGSGLKAYYRKGGA